MVSETEDNSQMDSLLLISIFGCCCSWSLWLLVCIVLVSNWNNRISATKDFPIKIRKRYFLIRLRFPRTPELNFCFLRELALPKHPVKSCNWQMLEIINSGLVKISCWISDFQITVFSIYSITFTYLENIKILFSFWPLFFDHKPQLEPKARELFRYWSFSSRTFQDLPVSKTSHEVSYVRVIPAEWLLFSQRLSHIWTRGRYVTDPKLAHPPCHLQTAFWRGSSLWHQIVSLPSIASSSQNEKICKIGATNA